MQALKAVTFKQRGAVDGVAPAKSVTAKLQAVVAAAQQYAKKHPDKKAAVARALKVSLGKVADGLKGEMQKLKKKALVLMIVMKVMEARKAKAAKKAGKHPIQSDDDATLDHGDGTSGKWQGGGAQKGKHAKPDEEEAKTPDEETPKNEEEPEEAKTPEEEEPKAEEEEPEEAKDDDSKTPADDDSEEAKTPAGKEEAKDDEKPGDTHDHFADLLPGLLPKDEQPKDEEKDEGKDEAKTPEEEAKAPTDPAEGDEPSAQWPPKMGEAPKES